MRERENNIKLKWFDLLMNSSSTERASYCNKVKKIIRYGEADAGGFWGFIANFLVFLRFGEAGANALRCLIVKRKIPHIQVRQKKGGREG